MKIQKKYFKKYRSQFTINTEMVGPSGNIEDVSGYYQRRNDKEFVTLSKILPKIDKIKKKMVLINEGRIYSDKHGFFGNFLQEFVSYDGDTIYKFDWYPNHGNSPEVKTKGEAKKDAFEYLLIMRLEKAGPKANKISSIENLLMKEGFEEMNSK